MKISLSYLEFGWQRQKIFLFLTTGILLSNISKFPHFVALKTNIVANFVPSGTQDNNKEIQTFSPPNVAKSISFSSLI
jgi:Na+/alanine symporter